MLDCSVDDSILLMSYYTNFIHTIYLLKWFGNNYTQCYGLSLNVMKEGIFSEWRASGLTNKYTMFWISERGDNKFQVFGRGIQKEGDMY